MTDPSSPPASTESVVQPPVYGAAQMVYPVYVLPPAQPKGLSIASLVLGLVSIVFGFTFVLPLVGLILGIVGVKKEPSGRGMSITGIILSGLILAGWIVVVVIFILVTVAAGAAVVGSSNPSNWTSN